MDISPKWIDVVTHPLGLVAFVLFWVFTLLSYSTSKSKTRWLMPTFVVMALTSLIGGLVIAWNSLPTTSDEKKVPPIIIEHTEGSQSPIIKDNKAPVTITNSPSQSIDQEKTK